MEIWSRWPWCEEQIIGLSDRKSSSEGWKELHIYRKGKRRRGSGPHNWRAMILVRHGGTDLYLPSRSTGGSGEILAWWEQSASYETIFLLLYNLTPAGNCYHEGVWSIHVGAASPPPKIAAMRECDLYLWVQPHPCRRWLSWASVICTWNSPLLEIDLVPWM